MYVSFAILAYCITLYDASLVASPALVCSLPSLLLHLMLIPLGLYITRTGMLHSVWLRLMTQTAWLMCSWDRHVLPLSRESSRKQRPSSCEHRDLSWP